MASVTAKCDSLALRAHRKKLVNHDMCRNLREQLFLMLVGRKFTVGTPVLILSETPADVHKHLMWHACGWVPDAV